MNWSGEQSQSIRSAAWDQPPKRYESLPGQLDLFEGGDSTAHGTDSSEELFETGRDLPGAREREQKILWDIEA